MKQIDFVDLFDRGEEKQQLLEFIASFSVDNLQQT